MTRVPFTGPVTGLRYSVDVRPSRTAPGLALHAITLARTPVDPADFLAREGLDGAAAMGLIDEAVAAWLAPTQDELRAADGERCAQPEDLVQQIAQLSVELRRHDAATCEHCKGILARRRVLDPDSAALHHKSLLTSELRALAERYEQVFAGRIRSDGAMRL